MSSLFPDFKVHSETPSANKHAQCQTEYRFANVSRCLVRTSHSTQSRPLVGECCFIVVFFPVLLFSFLSSFQPPRRESTRDPALSPKSRLVCANPHVVKVHYSFVCKLNSHLFRCFGAGGLPAAAALLFLPSLSLSSSQTEPSEHRAAPDQSMMSSISALTSYTVFPLLKVQLHYLRIRECGRLCFDHCVFIYSFIYYLRIENAEGYVLIAVYLFIYLFVCLLLA